MASKRRDPRDPPAQLLRIRAEQEALERLKREKSAKLSKKEAGVVAMGKRNIWHSS